MVKKKFLEDQIAEKREILQKLSAKASQLQTYNARVESHLQDSDHEENYPTLICMRGSPFKNIPKRILAVLTDLDNNPAAASATECIPLYLVSYKQDYEKNFYSPSIVPGFILELMDLNHMIFQFYDMSNKREVLNYHSKEIIKAVTELEDKLKVAENELDQLTSQIPFNLWLITFTLV